jgi:metallophosphoesterase (TIGR00282 family)
VNILFIGDLVSEASVAYLEANWDALHARCQPDFVVANAENLALGMAPGAPSLCGMTTPLVERLFALGVHALTGGNHSWDGPEGRTIHDEARILRPLNYSPHAPGRGALIVERGGYRLGIINLMSQTAMPGVDWPLDAFERQLAAWHGQVDGVLVDFHGESVLEKLAFAFAVDGYAVGVLGTHTHVPTSDVRLLPQGTAYVSDVGMTGPSGGIQGYDPQMFVERLRLRLPSLSPLRFAAGPIELGAVLLRVEGQRALDIQRITLNESS